MARINWEDFEAKTRNQGTDSNGPKVGYFSLKNDQDESIVRFMHDSVDDFDLLVVHKTQDETGKFKSVNCLRQPEDPIDMCPICADGGKTEYKIYLHLLEYVRQEDGTVKPYARVWERSSSYAKKLATLMKEYGPLSDCLFKVKRNGAKGNLKTEYDIMYLSDKIYPNSVYVKDTTLLENYQALGHAVLDKTYEELVKDSKPMTNTSAGEPTYQAVAPTMSTNPQGNVPTYNTDRPVRTYSEPAPMSNTSTVTPSENRPRRYY